MRKSDAKMAANAILAVWRKEPHGRHFGPGPSAALLGMNRAAQWLVSDCPLRAQLGGQMYGRKHDA